MRTALLVSFRSPTSPHFPLPLRATTRSPSRNQSSRRCPAVSVLRIAFASGGSGGHVTPAIAIADELKAADPEILVLFLGSASGIESRLVPSSGYDLRTVPATPLARPFVSFANLLLLFRLAAAAIACWNALREFRPDIVVGTGGYASVPTCLAAAAMGVDVVIQEQNCSPGIATGLLFWFAKRAFIGFEPCVEGFGKWRRKRCVVSGNPIRADLRRFVSEGAAKSHFFPEADGAAQVVLVLGGSSGANTINVAVLNMYSGMVERWKNRYIIWQTGDGWYPEMESLLKSNPRVVLAPFLQRMDLAYAATDVVVCRAGAMTCSEILATGKPSIMIPLPFVAEDHQTENASYMAEIAGSRIILERKLDPGTLEDAINEVLGNKQIRAEMSERAFSNARPDAAKEIANGIISFVRPAERESCSIKES